jgi:hypothetical protein
MVTAEAARKPVLSQETLLLSLDRGSKKEEEDPRFRMGNKRGEREWEEEEERGGIEAGVEGRASLIKKIGQSGGGGEQASNTRRGSTELPRASERAHTTRAESEARIPIR